MGENSDSGTTIPVRRLHNYVYCPRLMYFQFVENVFVPNADVVKGKGIHRYIRYCRSQTFATYGSFDFRIRISYSIFRISLFTFEDNESRIRK